MASVGPFLAWGTGSSPIVQTGTSATLDRDQARLAPSQPIDTVVVRVETSDNALMACKKHLTFRYDLWFILSSAFT
jgi:hypothetical protein